MVIPTEGSILARRGTSPRLQPRASPHPNAVPFFLECSGSPPLFQSRHRRRNASPKNDPPSTPGKSRLNSNSRPIAHPYYRHPRLPAYNGVRVTGGGNAHPNSGLPGSERCLAKHGGVRSRANRHPFRPANPRRNSRMGRNARPSPAPPPGTILNFSTLQKAKESAAEILLRQVDACYPPARIPGQPREDQPFSTLI
jgi:hypothetical protein